MSKEDKSYEEYIDGKECTLCRKFFKDCENNEGIYVLFKNKKPSLVKVTNISNYIKKATAIIRSHPVCKKHFKVIKRDNDLRQKKDMEITESLELLNYRRSSL